MHTVTNSPTDAKPCRDYDPMFKLYGCELAAGHDGPHRDFRGNEWEEYLDPQPERCDSHAPWGSGYPDQRCVHGTGHDGQHRDRSGNGWDEAAAGPDDAQRKEAFAESAAIFASAGFTAADVEPFAAAEDVGAWPSQAPAFRPLADALREHPAATP